MAQIRDELNLDIAKALRSVEELKRSIDDATSVDTRAVGTLDRKIDGAAGSAQKLADELETSDDEARRFASSMGRADRQIEKTEKSAEELNRGLGKMSKAMKVFVGLAATGLVADRLVQFGKLAVSAASSLTESVGKAQVVFGDFADEILAFTDDAPTKLRLSTQAALEMTGTFGNLFVALGLSQREAAELSPAIVQLGADLGSFNNIEVGEVLEKLRSGLVGEAEPLRTLGVNINEALTKAKAFEMGLVGANGVVSDAAKVQARWALILEQTTTAQGDAARTSETFAGATAILAGKWENFQADIGEKIVPALTDLIPVLEGVIDTVNRSSDAVDSNELVAWLAAVVNSFGLVGDVTGGVGDLLQATFSTFTGFGRFLGKGLKGDLEGAFGAFSDVGDQIDSVAERYDKAVTRIARQGLTAAGGGVRNFASSIIWLSQQDAFGTMSKVANGFDQLATTAGLTKPELTEALRLLLANAEAAGLTGDEIEYLRRKYLVSLEVIDGWQVGMIRSTDATVTAGGAAEDLDYKYTALSDTLAQASTTTRIQNEALAENVSFLDDARTAVEKYFTAMDALTDPILRTISAQDDWQTAVKEMNKDHEQTQEELLKVGELYGRYKASVIALGAGDVKAGMSLLAQYISEGAGIPFDEALAKVEAYVDGATADIDALWASLRGMEPITIPINIMYRVVGGIPEGANPATTGTPGGLTSGGVTVNINNPTTTDVTTGAAQAAQTIGAVTSSLTGRVR